VLALINFFAWAERLVLRPGVNNETVVRVKALEFLRLSRVGAKHSPRIIERLTSNTNEERRRDSFDAVTPKTLTFFRV